MFRQKALDRLQSPDNLDQLLTVVLPRTWVTVLALGVLCVTAVLWSVFGEIPITVDGFGVLINPGNVRGIQSNGTGQLIQLKVRPGQSVSRGDVIAELNQPELREQLKQQIEKREETARFNETAERLDEEKYKLESESILAQRRFIENEMTKVRDFVGELNSKTVSHIQEQRKNLAKSKELLTNLNAAMSQRVETIGALRLEGLASEELSLKVRSDSMETDSRLANLEVQFRELELQDIQREQNDLDWQSRLSDLQLQLLKLEIEQQRIDQDRAHSRRNLQAQLDDMDNLIQRLEIALKTESQVVSEFDGRLLEISVAPGQVIARGTRVGTIEVDDPNAQLKNLAYFNVKDGKLIEPGARVHVTPATVERERYGSIIGKVVKVSSFPVTPESVANQVGNDKIAQALMQSGGAIAIETDLERDSHSFTGYKWTSKGPDLKLTAGTTTTVRVTVERRAPITYVLPLLQTWVFGQKDDQLPEF